MSLTDLMSHSGLAWYAEVAMVLFLVAFLAIGVWTFWPSRREALERAARLPLDDAATPTTRVTDEPAHR